MKTRTLATKQSPPARFLRLGDVVLDCGAAGHDHGTRGGRWSWLRRAALSGAFGDEREGEQRRRRGSRERGAVEGECVASRRESRAMRGQQEVEAGGGARARARRHASAYWQRLKTVGSWAGPAGGDGPGK